MKCPFCGHSESKVVDSRPAEEGSSIRRRRECLSCAKRFTTYETLEQQPLLVVKKDQSRELFNAEKLRGGIIAAIVLTILPEKLRFIGDFRMLMYAIVLISVMLVTNNRTIQSKLDDFRGRLRRRGDDKAALAVDAEGGASDE